MSRRPVKNTARLAAILDSLPDALLLVDRNGTVVNANRMALDSFESATGPLLDTPLLELLPGFDRARVSGARRINGATVGGRRLERTKPKRIMARRTDGTTFPVEVTSSYLPDDHGDELLMLVCRNLTDAVDAEVELRRQQRQTELLLRAASEGICGIDTQGRIVMVNPAAAKILRYRASDLGGQDLHGLIHHTRADGTPYPPGEVPLLDTMCTGRKHRRRHEVLWRKDGTSVAVEMSTAPVLEGDALIGAMMTFTDTSGAEETARRHNQVVSVLERELRKPTRAIHRQLGQLANGKYGHLSAEAQGVLRRVVGDHARVVGLCDDVLDFERLSTGAIQLEAVAADLEHLVQYAVNSTAELASAAGVGFAVHASPAAVVVDRERIIQALGHLLTDVILASGPGTTIVVGAARRAGFARVEVRGPVGGTESLHLPIARGLIECHHGSLQAHDVPGRGNTYVVQLPLAPGEASRALPVGNTPPCRVNGTGAHQRPGAHAGSRAETHTRSLAVPSAPIPQQKRIVNTSASSLSEIPPFVGLPPQRPSSQRVVPTDPPDLVAPPTERDRAAPGPASRRLLVWSEPDRRTADALEAHGYRSVVVRSYAEVDHYASADPAALFVDPLTGPITRTALRSLRRAAQDAGIPVVVTAGLGGTASVVGGGYGADPAVLLKALAPVERKAQVPWVLLVESQVEIAAAFTASLRRQDMQVLHAVSESEAVSRAASVVPDLVVMDLMLVRRRRVGVFDWLRTHGRLHSTPIVVYTSLDLDPGELRRLHHGETVLYLAERSGGEDVQRRLVDILGKIGQPR